MVRDISPTKAWEIMSKSDIFMGAKSSFSIIGALLANPPLAIFTKFQHNLPNNWLIVEEAKSLSPTLARYFVYHSVRQRIIPEISKRIEFE